MTKSILILLSFIYLNGKAQELPYTITILNEPFQELGETISLSNGEIWDDPNYTIPLGFNFQLIDEVANSMVTAYPGSQLLLALEEQALNTVTPFGDDIIDAGPNEKIGISPISYAVEGNEGSRIAKIEWLNVGFYDEFVELATTSNRISFQVWLYEGSNIIEYRYGQNSIKNEDVAFAFGGPMVGMTKNFDLNNFVWESFWFLGGDPLNPTVSNFTDNVNPPDASILLNANIPDGLVYRFTPTFVSVPEVSSSQNLKVYPTRGNNNIQLDWNGQNSNMIIYDISGRNVMSQQVSNGVQKIDISHFAAGTYLLSVIDKEGAHTIKFIKE